MGAQSVPAYLRGTCAVDAPRPPHTKNQLTVHRTQTHRECALGTYDELWKLFGSLELRCLCRTHAAVADSGENAVASPNCGLCSQQRADFSTSMAEQQAENGIQQRISSVLARYICDLSGREPTQEDTNAGERHLCRVTVPSHGARHTALTPSYT